MEIRLRIDRGPNDVGTRLRLIATATGIEVLGRERIPGLPRTPVLDDAGLPPFQKASDPARGIRKQELVWSDRQFESAVHPKLHRNAGVVERVIRLTVARIDDGVGVVIRQQF